MTMKNKTQLLFVLLIISVLFTGCGTSGSAFKPGTQYSVEGKIDNVFQRDLLYKKEVITVTSVGFVSGQGISIVGLHPGLSIGKKVRVRAEFFKNINGTDVFHALQITALTEQKLPASQEADLPVSTPEEDKQITD